MAGKFGLDPHRLEDEALELAGGCGRSRASWRSWSLLRGVSRLPSDQTFLQLKAPDFDMVRWRSRVATWARSTAAGEPASRLLW
jgi:hypothetical protein